MSSPDLKRPKESFFLNPDHWKYFCMARMLHHIPVVYPALQGPLILLPIAKLSKGWTASNIVSCGIRATY